MFYRCAIWIRNSGREDFGELPDSKLQYRVLCANHFKLSAFANSLRKRLLKNHPNSIPVPWFQSDNEEQENETTEIVLEKRAAASKSDETTVSEGVASTSISGLNRLGTFNQSIADFRPHSGGSIRSQGLRTAVWVRIYCWDYFLSLFFL